MFSLPPAGRLEKGLLAAAVVYAATLWLPAPAVLRLVAGAALIVLGCWIGIRLARRAVRTVLWSLRNRLLAGYLFIAVIPILLILVLAGVGAKLLAGQIAVYLVTSEFDRRISALRAPAASLLRLPAGQRAEAVARIGGFFRDRYPGFELLIRDGNEIRFPSDATIPAPAPEWGETAGVVVRGDLLYGWARLVRGNADVTVTVPLSNAFLANLVPDLGDVSVVHFPTAVQGVRRSLRPHTSVPGEVEAAAGESESAVPPPANRFDMEVLWGAPLTIAIWDSPAATETALLAVHSRISAVMQVISRQKAESGLLLMLYTFASLFLAAELISFVIGFSITRTIADAVHSLYQGTEKVMSGDFSHRIEVKGRDQLADLSTSFNRMTENLERLVAVAKEKERLQTEIEIAREVQAQLFPKAAPALERLRLVACCNPARMVSGDYYDYQALSEGKAILALGDVAGKGISAALLMATLQSSLRAQLRHSLERVATVAGPDAAPAALSSSRLVSRLNQQLHADTSPEKYATFFFALYDDASGLLTYTNAGHLPPILIRRGQARLLEVNGTVVGAFPSVGYEESSIRLESGDLLVCYTDGITEPENEFGEMFGEERLQEVLLRNADRDCDEIVATVVRSVTEWTGSSELQDDMTLLLARRL